ncbi:MAG TPA: DUF1207 domain-containing protein [Planctomycetota bacterium]|nr:DUF1207 domain-containing protein [Planctomycetota bacterium]
MRVQWILWLACVQTPQDRPVSPEPSALERPAPDSWTVEIFPEERIYEPYRADPRQSRSGSKIQFPVRGRGRDIKIENALGGSRPLALWSDPRDSRRSMELSLEAAVFSRFDIPEQWDMDAADYRFGFPFVYREGPVALKVHVWHLTSHLGDEYLSRVEGAERLSYHLEELALGMAVDLASVGRAYAEVGLPLYVGSDTEGGRVQLGLEWVDAAPPGGPGPYAAADLHARREQDWDPGLTVQLGLLRKPSSPGGTTLRGFLEYYRGPEQQTQFLSEREHYWAVGFAADF